MFTICCAIKEKLVCLEWPFGLIETGYPVVTSAVVFFFLRGRMDRAAAAEALSHPKCRSPASLFTPTRGIFFSTP